MQKPGPRLGHRVREGGQREVVAAISIALAEAGSLLLEREPGARVERPASSVIHRSRILYIRLYDGPLPPSRGVQRGPMASVALQSMQLGAFTTSLSPLSS